MSLILLINRVVDAKEDTGVGGDIMEDCKTLNHSNMLVLRLLSPIFLKVESL